jgi:hypothetical protein
VCVIEANLRPAFFLLLLLDFLLLQEAVGTLADHFQLL